jgi:hypothetical protein
VNYGPNPAEVIEFVREKAAVVVRGNHDHSIGFDENPRCSERFRAMAEETRALYAFRAERGTPKLPPQSSLDGYGSCGWNPGLDVPRGAAGSAV